MDEIKHSTGKDTLAMSTSFPEMFPNNSYDQILAQNITVPPDGDKILFESIRHYFYLIVLPVIYIFGIMGNILSIVVFTRGRFRHALDEIEKSATTGLISLSVSDLLFCVVGLPEGFVSLHRSGEGVSGLDMFLLYYKTYKSATTNLFIYISTWLTVVVSVERYIAVCHPFHSRSIIKVSRTIIIDVIIYGASFLINIPGFLEYTIEKTPCSKECYCYFAMISDLYMNADFRDGYNIAWLATGGLLPLVALVFCNVRLVTEIYKSHSRSADEVENVRYSFSKITFILVAIVVVHILLVCPSMVLMFIGRIVVRRYSQYRSYQIVLVVTNVLQALNFSLNFLLYCAISRPFREIIQDKLCKNSSPRNSTNTSHRYELVHVQTDPKNAVVKH